MDAPSHASTISRSRRPFSLPLAVVDLDFLKHDPEIEAFFDDGLLDDVPSLHDSISSGSTLSEGAPFQMTSLVPASIPSFIHVTSTPSDFTVPEPLLALRQLEEDIHIRGISVVDYYHELQVSSVHLASHVPARAHVDGGALATTTERLDYLWCYHEYTPVESRSVARSTRC